MGSRFCSCVGLLVDRAMIQQVQEGQDLAHRGQMGLAGLAGTVTFLCPVSATLEGETGTERLTHASWEAGPSACSLADGAGSWCFIGEETVYRGSYGPSMSLGIMSADE